MRRWGQRAGVALAMGAVVAALMIGAPVMALADDAAPPPGTTPTTEPAPADPAPPADTTPATDPPTTTAPPITDAPTTDAPAPAAVPADAPAAQLTPLVTVTPSTDLANGQIVTVSGTGFSPAVQVGWAECTNGGTGAADCDVQRYGLATTDATGAFSAPYSVHRMLYTQNGTVDCASAPQTCTIGAGKTSDPDSEHAGAPLAFDPSIPLPPPPTLLGAPTSGLVSGQKVALFGGGFPAGASVVLQQCTIAAPTVCAPLGGIIAGSDGGFITSVAVQRIVVEPPIASFDCASAPGDCELLAYAISDPDARNSVSLTFDPNGPGSSAAITVTPDTDLVQYQSVEVHGTGFPAFAGVQLYECTTAATSFEDCYQNSSGFVPGAPEDGTFTQSLSIRRILHLTSGDVDCADAPGTCSVVAFTFGPDSAVVASAALGFDASVPPPPAPTISVTPDTGLVQGQQLAVTGADFPPNATVALGECATGAVGTPLCGGGGIANIITTDGNGAFSSSIRARRGIRDYSTYPPTVIDCASAPQACSISAFAFDGGDQATAPVSFDPSVPVVVPTVTVTPQTDLADRGLVEIHAEGFAPHDEVWISQCPAGAVLYGPTCSAEGRGVALFADENGVVDGSLRVHRTITSTDGGVIIVAAPGPVNCASAFGACVLHVESATDPLAAKDVALGFDPTAVAPPPVITTSPVGPYTDGEQVAVHGSGFTPDAVLGLGQCLADVEPNGRTCDAQPGGLFDQFQADANGEFDRTVTVHAQVQGTEGPIDCAATPGCVFLAANRSDFAGERATSPIAFGVGGTTPGPTAEAKGESATRALAFTGAGARTVPLAVAGFAFLLVGGALLLVSRRRRVAA